MIRSLFPRKIKIWRKRTSNQKGEWGGSLLFNVGAGLGENKKGQKEGNSLLSWEVTPSGFKPETYWSVVSYSIQLSYGASTFINRLWPIDLGLQIQYKIRNAKNI